MFSRTVRGVSACLMAVLLCLCAVSGLALEAVEQVEPAQAEASVPYEDTGAATVTGEMQALADLEATEHPADTLLHRVTFTDINGEVVGWVDIPDGYVLAELDGYPYVEGFFFHYWFDVRDELASPFVFGEPVFESLYLAPYYTLDDATYAPDNNEYVHVREVPALTEDELRAMIEQILQLEPVITEDAAPIEGEQNSGDEPGDTADVAEQAPAAEQTVQDALANGDLSQDQVGDIALSILDTQGNAAQAADDVTQTVEDGTTEDNTADAAEDELQATEATESAPAADAILAGADQSAEPTEDEAIITEEPTEDEAVATQEPTAEQPQVATTMTPLASSILDFVDTNTEEDMPVLTAETPTEGDVTAATEETSPEATLETAEPTDASDEPVLTDEGTEDSAAETAEPTEPTEDLSVDDVPVIPEDAVMADAPVDSSVRVVCTYEGDRLMVGIPVTLTAELVNFPATAVVSFQWQNDSTGVFADIPGANGRSYAFIADEENMRCNWQVRTVYWETAGGIAE